MNWSEWLRQALIVMKMELQRYVLGKRWLGVYLAALAPIGLFLYVAFLTRPNANSISDLSKIYALFYQTFALRLSIFFSCALVFSQLFRGEILEKTLHLYLLTPVRREVIAVGKYLAGVTALTIIFGISTIVTNILIYMSTSSWTAFFLEGDGISNLLRYLVVTLLACIAYGGIFTASGLYFRNPIVPAIAIGVWEAFYFVLPEGLQKITVMHYLQSILPLVIDQGPFSVIVSPTPTILSIPVLVGVAAWFVWITGRILRRTEVTYGAD